MHDILPALGFGNQFEQTIGRLLEIGTIPGVALMAREERHIEHVAFDQIVEEMGTQ
ncbi:MAG: hypothetical protein BWY57_02474 [Betaproteobacteria bacterium ADurb.Bin341]|nr:MAG: hypothetical protein BWY57_02474 [Betaproteobacteria bacterium ADurb.Bin341]